jgi:hypothetical protein
VGWKYGGEKEEASMEAQEEIVSPSIVDQSESARSHERWKQE